MTCNMRLACTDGCDKTLHLLYEKKRCLSYSYTQTYRIMHNEKRAYKWGSSTLSIQRPALGLSVYT